MLPQHSFSSGCAQKYMEIQKVINIYLLSRGELHILQHGKKEGDLKCEFSCL